MVLNSTAYLGDLANPSQLKHTFKEREAWPKPIAGAAKVLMRKERGPGRVSYVSMLSVRSVVRQMQNHCPGAFKTLPKRGVRIIKTLGNS